MKFGQYPAEYNPKVHGPYFPGRYYGKPDTPLGEVKLGEIGSWLSRRKYDPQSIARAIHRGVWNWSGKWIMPRKASAAGVLQAVVLTSMFYYFHQYRSHTNHRHAKYH